MEFEEASHGGVIVVFRSAKVREVSPRWSFATIGNRRAGRVSERWNLPCSRASASRSRSWLARAPILARSPRKSAGGRAQESHGKDVIVNDALAFFRGAKTTLKTTARALPARSGRSFPRGSR